MPTRLLKLDGDYIQICEDMTSVHPYACLSHCWGVLGPAMRLKTNNIESLKARVPVSQLPKTFRDAVEVCSKLDIHFLWIDALCKLTVVLRG